MSVVNGNFSIPFNHKNDTQKLTNSQQEHHYYYVFNKNIIFNYVMMNVLFSLEFSYLVYY